MVDLQDPIALGPCLPPARSCGGTASRESSRWEAAIGSKTRMSQKRAAASGPESPSTDVHASLRGAQKLKGLASLSVYKAAGKKKGYTVTSGTPSGHAGPLPRPDRFSRLARVALVVAEMLFTHASHSLAFKDHQRLQEGVLGVAEVVAAAAHPPDLYADPRTRTQLFLALASLSSAPHPRCPPPYSLITHLLQAGLSDCEAQVASTCQTALCVISLIVANPRVEVPARAFQQHSSQHPRNTQVMVSRYTTATLKLLPSFQTGRDCVRLEATHTCTRQPGGTLMLSVTVFLSTEKIGYIYD
ncbi:hypothetical protein GWK47_029278 [Chionoecetes opilio]|uniref:Uncharacterized protein n=1 Tax=Chionoecetes opilio TaxID=41210 RepID=A0A8J4YSK6_CHIOP|nr:hypothetical protein GWK47_029278 [Chionoecetes opilio]